MASPHSPSRSQTCHQMCPILENRTTTPHVSCPTCPIRAKRTTTMLISRSTCPILEKRTSKQPKNTRWMSETPESDTQSVAPLEFSYGKWRDQGWLRRTEGSRFKCWCRRRRRHRLVLIICSCRGLERGADDLVGALPRLVADLDVFARAWFQGGCHVVRAHEPVPGPGLVHVDEHGADQSDQGLA